MTYLLTHEGRRYLDYGLPEKRLIEYLSHGPVSMEDAKEKFGNDFAIALQWAKKYGVIEIRNGSLSLTGKKSNLMDQVQDGLHEVSKGGEPKIPDILNLLLSRKLIEIEREGMVQRAEKLSGKEITNLSTDLIKTGMWKKVKLKPYNVEAAGKIIHIGKQQPYNRFLGEVRRKIVEMGFKEMTGPTIELEFWNFDAMFQPQNHPSRDWTQTYSLKNPKGGSLPDKVLVDKVRAAHENGGHTGSTGWGYKWSPEKAAKLMPRAHGTALSARTIAGGPVIPGKYFAIARCYRPDVIDATHGVEFNHCEGIVIDESLNFRSLLGILKDFALEFAGAEKVKFLPDYYPFVEPGVQMSAKHPQLGWVELGGAGIFREEFTNPLGVDAPVIAWGLGIDRLAMFKLGINDIRNLFSQDLKWLRNCPVL
jgi:phenylalanyl-tRNA synthetase alpha chain